MPCFVSKKEIKTKLQEVGVNGLMEVAMISIFKVYWFILLGTSVLFCSCDFPSIIIDKNLYFQNS